MINNHHSNKSGNAPFRHSLPFRHSREGGNPTFGNLNCPLCKNEKGEGGKSGGIFPCILCKGGDLRVRTANFILRRMGFATRESFDLHCATLKATLNNNNNPQPRHSRESGNLNNESGNPSSPRHSRPLRYSRESGNPSFFATITMAFFGGGVNAVSREEFDAHNAILANAEATMQQQQNKTAPKNKNKNKSTKKANKEE